LRPSDLRNLQRDTTTPVSELVASGNGIKDSSENEKRKLVTGSSDYIIGRSEEG